MLLSELFELYSEKRLKGCSHNTHRLYRHSIKAFEKTLGRAGTTDDLTDDNLHKHMWRLVDEGRSRATANKDCAQIGAMWRFANRNSIVSTWPNVRLLQEPERVPMAWMPDEMNRLFESIEREPGFVCGVPARLWWRCLVNVLLETGERIKPIRELDRTAASGQFIKVQAELRKRMTRDKLYKITTSTAADIQQLLGLHNEEKLFPWDRSETYIYKVYTDILRRAKLSQDAQSKFHRLRRSTASIVKKMGGDPTAAMDHASARTTRRYLDPRLCDQAPTSDFIERFRKNGS